MDLCDVLHLGQSFQEPGGGTKPPVKSANARPRRSRSDPPGKVRWPGRARTTVGQVAPSASRCGWLKQLDRVAGRIVEQNLLPTGTGDHVVSEAHARPA